MRIAPVALLVVLAFAPACAPARAPDAAYPYAMPSRILESPDGIDVMTFDQAIALGGRGTPADVAAELSARLEKATSRCAQRSIRHAPGSTRVEVDLGVGCTQGAGAFTVDVRETGGKTVLDFAFRDFAFRHTHLDGFWRGALVANAAAGSSVLSFSQPPPTRDIVPEVRVAAASSSPRVRASSLGTAVQIGLAFAELIGRLVLLPIQLAAAYGGDR